MGTLTLDWLNRRQNNMLNKEIKDAKNPVEENLFNPVEANAYFYTSWSQKTSHFSFSGDVEREHSAEVVSSL